MKKDIIGCPHWNVPLVPSLHFAGPLPEATTPQWIVYLLTLARSFSQPWCERMLKWNCFTLEPAQAQDNRCHHPN